VTIENVSPRYDFLASGAQTVPIGATEPGPLMPGDAYEVTLHAGPEQRLSFALMFVHSNDLFYAPSEEGIALFDDEGRPVSGDVTDQVMLWDAGTEQNEEPGLGMHQAPRQSGPDSGPMDSNTMVRLAADDFGNLPAVADVLEATLTPKGDNAFVLRIENVSTEQTLALSDDTTAAVPLAPVAFVLHTAAGPLFSADAPDRGEGLEALAEDGDPSALLEALGARTGLTTPLAPGAYAVHDGDPVIFAQGQAAQDNGLEALAEDGDPALLSEALSAHMSVVESGTFAVPTGASEPGPAVPGSSYSFTVTAMPGERLSFATMLVQSNDLFFAPAPGGIELFDAAGMPRTGDVTAEVQLWNAGTEVDQAPGAGPDQAPRQSGPNAGAAEGGVVDTVMSGGWPEASEVVRITITPS
jgi:hypothetical protein